MKISVLKSFWAALPTFLTLPPLITAVVGSPSNETALNKFRNVVYVGDWTYYSQGLEPQKLPYGDITHLVYSFGNISEADGEA